MRKLSAITAIVSLWALLAAGQALAASGEPDRSFGSGGAVSLETPAGSLPAWYPEQATAGADGSTYVLEESQECKPAGLERDCRYQQYVVRYLANGSRDASYGGAKGFALISEADTASGQGNLVVDPAGRLLIAQSSSWDSPTGMVLTRLDTSGRPDPTFGSAGRVSLTCTCFYESPTILFDREGRIVLVSPRNEMVISPTSAYGVEFGPYSVYLTRLQANGAVDSTFGTSGVTTIQGFTMWSAAIRQNGSVVMVAFQKGQGSFIVRVSANGRAVDRQFNASKRLRGRKPSRILTLPKNRVAVAGTQARGAQWFVTRLRGNGTIDPHYRRNGIAEPNFAVMDLAADVHGRVLMVGTSGGRSPDSRSSTGILRRLLANGKADRKFVNGLADRIVPWEVGVQAFYAGTRPMVFQLSTFVPECRAYCRPDPSLFRFKR